MICAKGNPFIQILEYSTQRPKFETQILISNFVGQKFSCWHLDINSFWCQLGLSLELSCWNFGINSVWRQLVSPLGFLIPGDSFLGIPHCFPPFGFNLIIPSCGTKYFPVENLLYFSFIGELNK